jgi:hypothetical protein
MLLLVDLTSLWLLHATPEIIMPERHQGSGKRRYLLRAEPVVADIGPSARQLATRASYSSLRATGFNV